MSCQTDLSHLPDASEELAATADLHVCCEGASLPLHSQVLAAGSRVLRTAFSSDAAGVDTRAAAVAAALHGSSLDDARTFLRLLYDPSAVQHLAPTPDSLKGVLTLAHKLDAPALMHACDVHLQAEVHNSWADWLLLADAFGLRRLAGTMAQRVLKDMLACPAAWEQQQARLNGLGPHALGMLLDATHKAFSYKLAQVGHAGYRGSCGEYVPDLTSWRQFGDA